MVNLQDIRKAYNRIGTIVNRTPVMTSKTLDSQIGAEIFFKCENFQRGGAFKFRGAYNALSQLSIKERKKGVITHSSGNHAQALALASRLLGISCTVVMPKNSTPVKIKATRDYGANVILCLPTLKGRVDVVDKLTSKYGYVQIHPYDNDNVICGAGTTMLEFAREVNHLDYVFCPIGGGGLISGVSTAAKGLVPPCTVFGVEPKKVDDAYRSFHSGKIETNKTTDTIADGLRTNLCDRTFEIIRKNVDDIITVSESDIIEAMRFLWERMKLVIEPSGAVSFAGLMQEEYNVKGKRVGIILSGGNVDFSMFTR